MNKHYHTIKYSVFALIAAVAMNTVTVSDSHAASLQAADDTLILAPGYFPPYPKPNYRSFKRVVHKIKRAKRYAKRHNQNFYCSYNIVSQPIYMAMPYAENLQGLTYYPRPDPWLGNSLNIRWFHKGQHKSRTVRVNVTRAAHVLGKLGCIYGPIAIPSPGPRPTPGPGPIVIDPGEPIEAIGH